MHPLRSVAMRSVDIVRRSTVLACATVCAGLMFTEPSAHAAPITVNFAFRIDAIVSDPDGLWATNNVAAGNIYTGSFTYDDTSTNLASNDTNYDDWAVSSFTSNFPGAASSPLAGINAADLGAVDRWIFFAQYTLPGSAGVQSIIFEFRGAFGYNVGSPIDVGVGLGHPIQGPPILDTWASGSRVQYGISGLSTGSLQASAYLTTGTLPDFGGAPVPEPATLMLLGTGLAAVVLRRRFSKRT